MSDPRLGVTVLFLRGDQIATYTGLASSGNSNGVKVTLTGVQPLGTASQIFRVVVRQFNANDPFFNNGQFVDIHAYPDDPPPDPPLFRNLNPQHDQFQGRASSSTHQIFTQPTRIVFQTDPIQPGTLQFGPGLRPLRSERMPFDAFPASPPIVPCFLAGTMIDTDAGPLPVEMIRPGMRVQTRDNGWQTVIWAGGRRVPGHGPMAPVRIRAGAFGNPRDLWVSPQHRLLVEGGLAELTTGLAEALAPAALMVDGDRVARVGVPRACYRHLLCEGHEVIVANGLWAETLLPGRWALAGFGAVARDRLLRAMGSAPVQALARPLLNAPEARLLGLQGRKTGVRLPAANRRRTAG